MLIDVIRGDSVTWANVIIRVISCMAVIFITMPIHEFAHSFVAYKLGDISQKYSGRLMLNPFAHIDYWGALFIILFGFGWAKPVNVNSCNFKNHKRDMAITALAGPIANLVMAFVCMFLYNALWFIAFQTAIATFAYIANVCYFVALINVSLAVFNLIPCPPLDGSKILAMFLPNRLYYKFMQYEQYFYYISILLIMTGLLDRPINFLVSYVLGAFSVVTGLPFGL